MAEMSLYERLGGEEGIRRIVEDIVAAHLGNPIVRSRFENVKDVQLLKQRAWEFFCAGSGGPQTYTGKDMVAAHKGMNITEEEYSAVTGDILAALAKSRIGDDTKKDVLAILHSLKGQIVGV